MSTVLEETSSEIQISASARLRATMAAVRVSLSWFGTRKSLTPEQRAQAADAFGAEGQFLSAGKKLLDTSHPAYKAVTAVRSQILSYWKGLTLPFPEPGIRLIRQSDVAPFNVRLGDLQAELEDAVCSLEEHYVELRTAARERLGTLFNRGDYPLSLRGLFSVQWDFPSIEPPDYLRQLSPALFEQEQARVTARFTEAVELAEQAFITELASLVSHLSERISGQEDGKPKIFRDTAVTNLKEFFDRFRQLNVRSNEQLDELVSQAQQIVRGVQPQELRDSASLRQQVSSQLAGVQSVLDGLLVDRPRRNILCRAK